MVILDKRRTVAITAAGVLAVSLSACAQGGTTGSTTKDVTIRVATAEGVTALDPAGAYDTGSRTVHANIYQTLLTIIPGKATPVPDAADCQFDTPTTYTCTLKSKLTFHNDHDLRASDVKFSFDRMVKIKDPQGPSALFATLGNVQVVDEVTVTFNLKRADATFPYLLTTTAAAIVDEQVFPKDKLLPDTKVVGSGPYRLTSYKPGESAVLEKFADYHGVRPPENNRVDIKWYKASADVKQALTNGSADVGFRGIGPQDLKTLRDTDSLQVVEGDAAEIRAFAFHFKSAIVKKTPVRRAVAQLIDRATITKKVYDGQVTPLFSLMPTGFGGHTESFKNEYKEPSRAKAAAILAEGGIAAPVTLTLGYTPTHFGGSAGAEAAEVKRQLEASGLFKVTLKSAPWPQFQQQARAGTYDLFHLGWVPDFPDGDNFLAPFLKDGGFYQNGYKSQLANRLIELEVGSQNNVDRDSTFRDLQTLVANDVPAIPIWQGRMSVVAGKDVKNVLETLNPLFYFYYSYLTK
ncbi:ABC transporter substrate-binding protein [Kribbella sp. NBC_01245]|uniref:ABC transporter substrate-binding protein n=1 Tax=Kribbella sp. NBC_01245 TaxID=2903578 RepID=UPI002E2B1FE2|nr:ABC transporter substrate-binding protein [Kribbella sp. NBC_01245]